MTGERTVPLLPCRAIDDIEEFYTALGFVRTYRQQRPNPYLTLEYDDIGLHFFGIPEFDPAGSYGTCLVIVPDIGALHAAFTIGLRDKYGKVAAFGIPRMTRPRPRKNAAGLTGFAIVDPGGNWIRFTAQQQEIKESGPVEAGQNDRSPVAVALANAVVLGDSHGNAAQAAKILDGALRRHGDEAAATDRAEALVYRAELAVRLGDTATARELLDRFDALPSTVTARLLDTARAAADLRLNL